MGEWVWAVLVCRGWLEPGQVSPPVYSGIWPNLALSLFQPGRADQSHQGNKGCRSPHLALAKPVAHPIEGLDHVEIIIGGFEFFPQSFDMAVNGAVVHIDLVVIGGVHQ